MQSHRIKCSTFQKCDFVNSLYSSVFHNKAAGVIDCNYVNVLSSSKWWKKIFLFDNDSVHGTPVESHSAYNMLLKVT